MEISDDNNQYRREQKVSYQTFLQEQKVKLKSRYPFLTKDQINKKVQELWKHMGYNEKQHYTKTVLTKTPSKQRSFSKSPITKPRCKTNPDTTKRWENFKQLENKHDGYKNDFALQSPSPNSLSGSSAGDFSWLTSKVEDSSKIYKSKKSLKIRAQLNYKVPVIVHDEPHTPQGILKGKKGESSVEKRSQGRVSFSSENVQQNLDADSEKYDNNYTQESSDEEYSSKLLRRSDDEVFDFEDIDQHKMNIEGKPSSDLHNSSISENRCMDKLEKEIEKCSDTVLQTSKFKSIIDTKGSPENLNLFSYDDEINETKSSENPVVGKENRYFKSPSAKTKRKRRVKQKNLKKPPKQESFKSPLTRNMKSRSQQVTPVTDITDEIDMYTTPLMDEDFHQHMLKEIKKAPKKKSCQHDQIAEEIVPTLSKKMESLKKRARTSLIDTHELTIKHENSDDMGPTGDAKICREEKLKLLEGKFNTINVDLSQDVNLEISNGKTDKNVKKEHENIKVKINPNRFESYLLKESSPFVDDYIEIESPEVNSNSEDSELSEDLMKDSRETNQTLIKALLKMKQIVAGAPSSGASSVGSSPKLLSPALSGISQLSDMSSAPSDYIVPIKTNASPAKPSSRADNSKTSHNQQVIADSFPQLPTEEAQDLQSEDGILCQMFRESKKADVIQTIFTNRRLIPSAQSQASNFTQMYTDDDLFL